jgi:hypothetical protein
MGNRKIRRNGIRSSFFGAGLIKPGVDGVGGLTLPFIVFVLLINREDDPLVPVNGRLDNNGDGDNDNACDEEGDGLSGTGEEAERINNGDGDIDEGIGDGDNSDGEGDGEREENILLLLRKGGGDDDGDADADICNGKCDGRDTKNN